MLINRNSSNSRLHQMIIELTKTRQIIQYRAAATLRRPQIKQYTASNGGGGYKEQNIVIAPIVFFYFFFFWGGGRFTFVSCANSRLDDIVCWFLAAAVYPVAVHISTIKV